MKRFLSRLCLLSALFLVTLGGEAQNSKQIKQLRDQRLTLKKQIQESETQLSTTKKDVKSQLTYLNTLNSQIGVQEQYVNTISEEVAELSSNIGVLEGQLKVLRQQLQVRKNKYAKSVQYLFRNRSAHNKILFVLSAKDFRTMYRRLRWARQFSKYQRQIGEMIQREEARIQQREAELRGVKLEKDQLLNEGKAEQGRLQKRQQERQTVLAELNKKQSQLQRVLASQRQKAKALDAKIDNMVRAEIAAAERRRKAEAARAAAAKKKAAAAAKAKAEKEAAARKAAAAAEARRRETKAKADAEAKRWAAAEAERQAKLRRTAENKRRAEEKKAEARRAEQTAKAAKRERERADAEEKKAASAPAAVYTPLNDNDSRMSSSFEANRGRLPMPVTGAYRITTHYGTYSVQGLSGVQLDSKGINITTSGAAQARSVFNGMVTSIFSYGGLYNVIVRHGAYLSVYCNLSSVSVRNGQSVSTRQTLGSIASDGSGTHTLHFQLRRETAKLNPEAWLGR